MGTILIKENTMKRLSTLAIFLALAVIATACGGTPSGTPFAVSVVQADLNDPVSVVNAFFIARSAFDTNAAMQYIDENSVIISDDTFSGSAEIRDFIQARANENYQFEVTNPQVNGNQVTFTLVVYQNGVEVTQVNGQATVQNGVIPSLTIGE